MTTYSAATPFAVRVYEPQFGRGAISRVSRFDDETSAREFFGGKFTTAICVELLRHRGAGEGYETLATRGKI